MILREAVSIARVARDVLTADDRLVVNVTEWAKRESAWKRLADTRVRLSEDFIAACIPARKNSQGKKLVTINSHFDSSVPERRHVRSIKGTTWRAVQAFLGKRSLLTAPEVQLLRQVIPGPASTMDVDTARALLQVYVKAVNAGWDEAA